MWQQTLHDPSAAGSPVEDAETGPELRLVRFRLALVVAATAVIAGTISGAVATAIFAGPGSLLATAVGTVPLPPIVLLVLAVVASAWLMFRLARQVVHPAEELDAARRHYGTLYASAKSDALLDSLTGLGNHRAFQEEFDRQLDGVRRYGHPVALVLIDLDDFKTINDAAGHAVGDRALAEISRLLRHGLRRSDRAFRVGGDEFAVLMPSTAAEEAYTVARRILSSCLEPRRDSGFERGFSFSAGIAAAPAMGITRADLYARADDALYQAKRDGRTAVRMYDPEHDERPLDGERLARAARSIVEIVAANAISPVYQPIVDVRSGAVVGFEGLARPEDGTGFGDAGSLFTVAEASGRTADLDWVCIRSILAGAGRVEPHQSLSVNLSPMTVEAPEFTPQPLLGLIARAGISPERVVIEITERQGVEDLDVLRSKLGACRAAGFRIAIDDVGAGNSGLRLLSQIHFDIVKIDLSLVHAGAQREASLDVVRSLTELATRWGASAVAEGVETAAQLSMVRSIGLGHAQGYLLGRPTAEPILRAVDLDRLLAEAGGAAMLRALAAAAS
ncbi:MAG TPA: EAL domain-containing protein [Clostridia bacterium]|nr:EAL domain-containing protein [Clostridia bacterium]